MFAALRCPGFVNSFEIIFNELFNFVRILFVLRFERRLDRRPWKMANSQYSLRSMDGIQPFGHAVGTLASLMIVVYGQRPHDRLLVACYETSSLAFWQAEPVFQYGGTIDKEERPDTVPWSGIDGSS